MVRLEIEVLVCVGGLTVDQKLYRTILASNNESVQKRHLPFLFFLISEFDGIGVIDSIEMIRELFDSLFIYHFKDIIHISLQELRLYTRN